MPRQSPPPRWDDETDVVVVGCGYAGAVAAIEAHDRGARVRILEKMPDPGGISICSAGGVRVAEDADAAFAYLQRTNGETTPDVVLRTLACGMTEIGDYVRALGAVNGAAISQRPAAGNYPFPGHATFGFIYVEGVPGFEPSEAYPQVRGSPAGALLFKVVEDNLRQRGLQISTRCAAQRLVTDESGAVIGVIAAEAGGVTAIRARRAVVLACGGFEADPVLADAYLPFGPSWPVGHPGNTGAGLVMAQQAGAALWHMYGCFGWFAFRAPDFPAPFAVDFSGASHVFTDADGRRFADETGYEVHDRLRALLSYLPAIRTGPGCRARRCSTRRPGARVR